MARSWITGTGTCFPQESEHHSLETMIFASASAGLADAGLERSDLDGVVIAASDQVDGRAISSMLTSGPAGAYLNEEINVASSPGHALVLAHMQLASGTHRRLLLTTWGKRSESAGAGTLPAERLAAEPFFERDICLTPLTAAAMQAGLHRARFPRAEEAALRVSLKNQAKDPSGGVLTEQAAASAAVAAYPLRVYEWAPEIDGAMSLVLERAERAVDGAACLQGVGWCSDSGRLADRDLTGVPHLARAAGDAFERAGVSSAATEISVWNLHDYSPDAEVLAYGAVGMCGPGNGSALAISGSTSASGDLPVNPDGGSLAGEAPFGGPMRKVLDAVDQVRGKDGRPPVARSFAQIASGFAGQFQSALVFGSEA